jgi:hypothetical protein
MGRKQCCPPTYSTGPPRFEPINRHNKRGPKGHHQPTQRIKRHSSHKVSKVPAGSLALPHTKSLPPGLSGRQFGPVVDTNQEGKAQTIPALGGTSHDSRTTLTRGLPTPGNQWRYIPKHLEHRTTNEVLPMTLSFFVRSFSLSAGTRTMAGGQRW